MIHSSSTQRLIGVAIAGSIASILSLSPSVQAQKPPQPNSSGFPRSEAEFVPVGAPTSTTSGGRRDANLCERSESKIPLEQSLVALAPYGSLGLTMSDHPTVLIYVPKTSAKTARFTLKDQDEKDITMIDLELTNQPAIYRLTPATTDPSLEVGKRYYWRFSVVCNPKVGISPNSPSIRGWVQRVQPDQAFLSKLKTASPEERLQLYRSAKIWFDAASDFASLRQAQPADQTWKKLLQLVGLDALAATPLQAQ